MINNKLIFFLYVALLFIGCRSHENKNLKSDIDFRMINQDSLLRTKNSTMSDSLNSLIEGIWAENKESNAFFYIKHDSIYYIDNLGQPIHYILKLDTLIMSDGIPTKLKIIKLTKDSLCILSEYLEEPIRLYRR